MAEGTEKDDKTEEATAKRLSEARGDGQVPFSSEVMSAAIPALESRGVYPIGRYGAWTYSYMERALLDGLELAAKIRGSG